MPYNFTDAPPQNSGQPQPQINLQELNDALAATADRWVPELFRQGRINRATGALHVADISGRPPRKTGSCVIQLKGDHAGAWWDFSENRGGEAVSTLKEFWGIDGAELLKRAAELAERHGAHVGKAPKRRAGHKSIDHLFREARHALNCSVPAAGTLVESYLASRGLTLPPCEDLLFNDSLTHWETKSGKPAMVARMRFPDGTPTGGIHRIYLKDDGSGYIAKMMLGPTGKNDGILQIAQPSAGGVLGIAEGIETALACTRLFRVPCWAALSTGRMRYLGRWFHEARPSHIKRLIVFADIGPDGESSAAELAAWARAAGIEVEVRLPRGGDDFNDDLIKGLWNGEENAPAPETVQRQVSEAAAAGIIAVPQTTGGIDGILETIKTLEPHGDPRATSAIVRQIAALNLSDMESGQLLGALARQAKLQIAGVRSAFEISRRELGLDARQVGATRAAVWASKLEETNTGDPKAIVLNAITALRDAPEWQNVICWDTFQEEIVVRGTLPWMREPVEKEWEDHFNTTVAAWMQKFKIDVTPFVCAQAVEVIAREHPFHPVRVS
jgi:hypothetical protein